MKKFLKVIGIVIGSVFSLFVIIGILTTVFEGSPGEQPGDTAAYEKQMFGEAIIPTAKDVSEAEDRRLGHKVQGTKPRYKAEREEPRFVHPLKFRGTKKEMEAVICYIKEDVKKSYAAIGMDSPSTLRMMEQEELKNFKLLTKINNNKLLDRTIQAYCDIGMCSYSTIYMMYMEENRASKKSLEWN